MHNLHWLTAAAAFGFCVVPLPAMAQTHDLSITPLTMADAISAERHGQDRFDQLASEMGQRVGRQDSTFVADLAESLQMPFLNDLLDESGELRLPLGLTVYDAMGTTSVGFGSQF